MENTLKPATDEDIAAWLCGGVNGGCEDWPACDTCRLIARIEFEKAAREQAEARVKELEDAIYAAYQVAPVSCREIGLGDIAEGIAIEREAAQNCTVCDGAGCPDCCQDCAGRGCGMCEKEESRG